MKHVTEAFAACHSSSPAGHLVVQASRSERGTFGRYLSSIPMLTSLPQAFSLFKSPALTCLSEPCDHPCLPASSPSGDMAQRAVLTGSEADSATAGEAAEPVAPPPSQKPAWLQRKVVVCVRDVMSREDMTLQLLEDVRCLMTFEVLHDFPVRRSASYFLLDTGRPAHGRDYDTVRTR